MYKDGKSMLIPIIMVVVTIVPLSTLLSQESGFFEDLEVVRFNAPYGKLMVLYYGTELPAIVDKETKIRGAGKKNVPADKVAEGTVITKLEYELLGSDYKAKEVLTNISSDGSMSIKGLFEGANEGVVIIDEYKVKLNPWVKLEGKK